jgi:hypothetical protein
MKTFRKESVIKVFRYAIDLALILLFAGLIYVIFNLVSLSLKNPADESPSDTTMASMSSPPNNIMMSFSNPNLGQNIAYIEKKFFIFCELCGLINAVALILITFQLKYIFKSFNLEDYFNPLNSARIKKIAIIIFIWVIADYFIRFIPDLTIPTYFIHSSIGVNSFRNGFIFAIFGFNLKMLMVSIIIYILSIVFKYGNNLKEETSLTI